MRSDLNVLEGHATSVTGRLPVAPRAAVPDRTIAARGRTAGRVVTLQALGSHGWRTLAHTRTGASGRFRLRYMPRETRASRCGCVSRAMRRTAARTGGSVALNVYRLAEASWYGGGGELACGGELTSATMGVANKTLPCGTLVTLRYDGRTVRVPVIDRGPYVAGREFDLTEATKQALGFGDVGEVWSTR